MKKIGFVFSLVLFFSVTFQANAQWVQTNNGLPNNNINVLISSNSHLFSGIADNQGIFTSSDSGNTWIASNNGLVNYYIKSLVINGQNIFAGTGGGVYFSSDNGANWSFVSDGYMGALISCMAISGDKVYATTGKKVYRTTNNGLTWFESTTLPYDIVALCTSGSNIFVGLVGGDVYRSSDNGLNWIPAHIPTPIGQYIGLSSFGVIGQILFAGARYGGSIFRTTDNGFTWENFENGLPNSVPVYTLAAYETYLFAGTDEGVFLSTDYGWNWNAVNSNLTNTIVKTITIFGPNIYVGTSDNGIWRRRLNEMITDIEKDYNQSIRFNLSQNYPNPFNPSTKISWQSPVSGWQTLKVYDILGNEVATLVDEYRNAGNYEIDFNPASSIKNLASSVYFYQLRTGDFVETKKMVLLK